MAGYVRQSTASIASGQPVASAPVNAEFNQLQAAFSGSSGHGHTGSTGDGPVLTSAAIGINTTTPGLIVGTGTLGAFTTATITGTALQIDVSNGTGASGNPTISIDAGYLGQTSISTLGTITTGSWNASVVPVLYGGTGTTTSTGSGSVVLSSSPTITGVMSGASLSFTSGGLGSLNVTGATTLNTLSTSSNATVGSTLTVTGSSSLAAINVSGTATMAEIHASGIDSTPIGASTPSSGAFTTVTASSTITGQTAIFSNTSGQGTVAISSQTGSGFGGFTKYQSGGVNNAYVGLYSGVVGGANSGDVIVQSVAGRVVLGANSRTADIVIDTSGNTSVGGTLAVTGNVTMPTQSPGDNTTKGATTAFVTAAVSGTVTLAQVYPVGSLYFSTGSTNPGTTFGFGTWSAFGAGRVLVGVGTGTDINSNTLTVAGAQSGGEYVHTLTTPEMPSHTHTDSGHTHPPSTGAGFTTITSGAANEQIDPGTDAFTNATTGTGFANIQNTGGGGSHNNVQPYIGVYIWQRTA